MKIKVTAPSGAFMIILTGSSPRTAEAILGALPFEARVSLWGDEAYFRIPVDAGEEQGARDTLTAGEVAYWPPGSALCLFWGPTPASRKGEIRAASPVNVVGRVEGSLESLVRLRQGDALRLERA